MKKKPQCEDRIFLIAFRLSSFQCTVFFTESYNSSIVFSKNVESLNLSFLRSIRCSFSVVVKFAVCKLQIGSLAIRICQIKAKKSSF